MTLSDDAQKTVKDIIDILTTSSEEQSTLLTDRLSKLILNDKDANTDNCTVSNKISIPIVKLKRFKKGRKFQQIL